MNTYVNRKTHYSSSEKNKTQYKISYISAGPILSKEAFGTAIKQAKPQGLRVINLKAKLSQKEENIKKMLTQCIYNVGVFKKDASSLVSKAVAEVNFAFIDFEHKEGTTETTELTWDVCIKILEENNLNYILTTSFRHSDGAHRLHLLMPTLLPIKDAEDYRYNVQEIIRMYFTGYSIDSGCTNNNRWVYPAKLETLKYATEFEKNDWIPRVLSEEERRISNQVNSEGYKKVEIATGVLSKFANQVKSLHGFDYQYSDSNVVMKFKRDCADRYPGVWHSTQYYSNESNKWTIWDKKKPYNVLFTLNTCEQAIFAEEHRESLQEELRTAVENWFAGGGGRNYIVTNEGLGKSTSILKFGVKRHFIYACQTNSRVKEVCRFLKENKIPFYHIESNYSILKGLGYKDLAKKYFKEYNKREEDITIESFTKFLHKEKVPQEDQDEILAEYERNRINLMDNNLVRIVTTKKLQIELIRATKNNHIRTWHNDHFIIFDEFHFSDWVPLKEATAKEIEKMKYISYPSIWNGSDTNIMLSQNNESLLSLLKNNSKVLVLTTERKLIVPLFNNGIYKFHEIIPFEWSSPYSTFDQKLYCKNIIYILTNTTRTDSRYPLLKGLSEKYEVDLIISNKINIIHDNEMGEIRVIRRDDGKYIFITSHASVKGSNNYHDKSLLIFATKAGEEETNLMYYSCREYFDSKFSDNKAILGDIQERIMVTAISQDLGRNQGFRGKSNKLAVVVLPILTTNSEKNFRIPDGLTYITENVIAMRKEEIIKTPTVEIHAVTNNGDYVAEASLVG
ncbi:MAG: hypothetical protein PHT88_05605 [Candidatus Moranbacteria bacterium]|nr:hypothetical protein [Candidatus Moranbacteria bacterium]